MYKGFNLKTNKQFSEYGKYMEEYYSNLKSDVENNLEKFVCKNGNLDGDKIINDWFPEVKTQVFISHSHSDEELAKNFSGWLKYNFNIDSFIDSCVWGYANDLLKQIDEKYSLFDGESAHYDYNKRNYSTSHVHMMLSTALMNMMDRCECIIFLNTDNSTVESNGSYTTDKNKVCSPWIYDELIITNYIRKKVPKRLKMEKKALEESSKPIYANDSDYSQLIIEYTGVFDALTSINDDILSRWEKLKILYKHKPENALDGLYLLT